MFINADLIRHSISELENIHPFYGITFLVCKRAELPIGSTAHVQMEALETEFLDEYFKPYPQSEFFYRLFRVSDKLKLWVHRTKYASSTLQSIRTRSAFSEAFLHERNTAEWGWTTDYQGVLRASLSYNLKKYKKRPVPGFLLATWLYRDRDWMPSTTAEDIIRVFASEFGITGSEESIFELSVPNDPAMRNLLQEEPISIEESRTIFGIAPDAEPLKGEILSLLSLQDVGPMRRLVFEPAPHLNLITGDNGLGKSFLMDCIWWALTGEWRSKANQAAPRVAEETTPQIQFQIAGKDGRLEKVASYFNTRTQSWKGPHAFRPTIEGLGIYARVDGSFSIWNPLRQSLLNEREAGGFSNSRSLNIAYDDVWEGIPGQIEGLLSDWIEWQNSSDVENPESAFETLKRVLTRISPADLGPLEPGDPVRLPFRPRSVPTIKHRYGEVPIIYESAAVKRALALAYLVVWTWNEHLVYADISKSPVERRMVIVIDEIESHLHPLWQRQILPALLDYSDDLPLEISTQFFVSTHSPLVLASAESVFDTGSDGLFHLNLTESGDVVFSEIDFVRHGTVDAWLTSNVFDLRHARSLEADNVIELAKKIQMSQSPATSQIEEVSRELVRTLSADDEFWPRWIYFAQSHGVKI